MRRREILKGAGLAVSGAVLGSNASGQEPPGPFSLPTARFSAKKAEQFPTWAFKSELVYPLVPRPSYIGTYEDVVHEDRAFGPTDRVKVGECFHGIAREWAETPAHWASYGCTPRQDDPVACWKDKEKYFGKVDCFDSATKTMKNWGEFKIKCYKIPIVETLHDFKTNSRLLTRVYTYGGMLPGPTFKMRLGQPVVVRYENHLEAEMSIHLHGGHSPSHSDGFPSFYVLQGKSRDYFYPNMLPLYKDEDDGKYYPDVGESQSTMWYHDHAMDATAYNVSKGVAGFAPCFGEEELALIATRVLPGYGPESCKDPEIDGLKLDASGLPDPALESTEYPGFYKHELGIEPYFNPFDIPVVLQDRVFDDATGQIAYDNTGHNGYLGDTMVVNGIAYPKLSVRNRKYRFRILDGSNARVFSLRILSEQDFHRLHKDGVDDATEAEAATLEVTRARHGRYEQVAKPFLRIGKDSWLWSQAVEKRRIVLAMANRADIVVDFAALTNDSTDEPLKPGETRTFYLVNTMPQTDGRGPKLKLDDGGDPRVLPLPFDTVNQPVKESSRPVALMKFEVRYEPPGGANDPPGDAEASVQNGTKLICSHRKIKDSEVKVVREFIFQRGKAAWQVNSRFYDPTIANACPTVDDAEEWVLKNEGGGWWHPIHIHLESHQLIAYEKDEIADQEIDPADPPTPNRLVNLRDVTGEIHPVEVHGMHDTQVLGPNTKVRIRLRTRTWEGPFVFHCHNLEHEDMRMMFNFEPVPSLPGHSHDPNVAPAPRTHGNDVTWKNYMGELPWEYATVPPETSRTAAEYAINPRKRPKTK